MYRTLLYVLALATAFPTTFLAAALASHLHIPPYFFLLAMVFLGPFRVRALVFVRWPCTGRPLRVAQAPVAADLGQALDVHGHIAAQVAFHNVVDAR